VLESEDLSAISKTMKKVENGKVEPAVCQRFIQKRSAGQPILWLVVSEKAIIFNQQLMGSPDSKRVSSAKKKKTLRWTLLVSLL
jgi:hypothetical protein